MPHTPSAAKRHRKADKRKKQNRIAVKKVKVARKSVAEAIVAGDAAKTTAEVQKTQAVLDRAATKGYIHKNKAARLKSRIAKRLKATAPK